MAAADRWVAPCLIAASLVVLACAGDAPPPTPQAGTSTGMSALPTLPQLPAELRDVEAPSVTLLFGADSARIVIDLEAGAQINALLPPVIETTDGRRFTLRALQVTDDSAYFVDPASVTVARTAFPIRGVLRTSFCRREERLCRSAQRDVQLENR